MLRFEVGKKPVTQAAIRQTVKASVNEKQRPENRQAPAQNLRPSWDKMPAPAEITYRSKVKKKHNFENLVEGKSNQLARAAARQVAENPGGA